MPDDIIVCPSCNRKLRMAEVHQGQVVQCPLCSVIFRTPVRHPPSPAAGSAAPTGEPATAAATGPAVSPGKSADADAAAGESGSEAEESGTPVIDVQRALLLPGMSLLICGVLSVLAGMASLREYLARGPEGVLRLMQEKASGEWVQSMTAQVSPEELFRGVIALNCLALLIALGIILGAIQMLRLEKYRLALLGSILACINIAGFDVLCCFFTAPLGLWSFMVLRLPEVRSAFDSPPEPAEPDEAESE